jgi:hypothetical protein
MFVYFNNSHVYHELEPAKRTKFSKGYVRITLCGNSWGESENPDIEIINRNKLQYLTTTPTIRTICGNCQRIKISKQSKMIRTCKTTYSTISSHLT